VSEKGLGQPTRIHLPPITWFGSMCLYFVNKNHISLFFFVKIKTMFIHFIWEQLACDHLGLADVHALSQSCKRFHLLITFPRSEDPSCIRKQAQTWIRAYVLRTLETWLTFDPTRLTSLGAIVSASALLKLVNREYWKPGDIDIWTDKREWDPFLAIRFGLNQKVPNPLTEGIPYPRSSKFPSMTAESKQVGTMNVHFIRAQPVVNLGYRSWAKFLVNSFDAAFLQIYFDGATLYIQNIQSIVDRESPILNPCDLEKPYRHQRQISRFHKYLSRDFLIGYPKETRFLIYGLNYEKSSMTNKHVFLVTHHPPNAVIRYNSSHLSLYEDHKTILACPCDLKHAEGIDVSRFGSNLFRQLPLTSKIKSVISPFIIQWKPIYQIWFETQLNIPRDISRLILHYLPLDLSILSRKYEPEFIV
jgi:hypothetical protein